MAKIFAVCSGCGGVGKTTVALSLAVSAAKRGKRTILLDASGVSLACDLALGLENIVVLDMADVANRQAGIEAALYKVPRYENLRFACASLYDDVSIMELTSTLLALHSLCDVLVIDCQTGHFALGRELLGREDVRLIVTRPDDVSIRASERMMMKDRSGLEERMLVVNRASALHVRKKMQYDAKTVEMTLDCPLAGCIPEDDSVAACSQKGRIALECDGPARRALAQLTDILLGEV